MAVYIMISKTSYVYNTYNMYNMYIIHMTMYMIYDYVYNILFRYISDIF